MTPWPADIQTAIGRLRGLRSELAADFAERETVVDVLALGAICQEHILLLGPPGTGKTELVTKFTHMLALEDRLFTYLLTRFTEPAEIFGPLDMPAFQEGRYHIRTERMLPAAAVAFLDEVFQGSSAILNTLLTLVHERQFHNGAERQRVPLISLIGASNELPDDPTLQAFSDRFALRLSVDPVDDDKLSELLDHGWALELERMEQAERAEKGQQPRILPLVEEAQLRALHGRIKEVDLAAIRPLYDALLRELRAEGVRLSDRRMVKGMKLIAGAALLSNRTAAQPDDLWPVKHMWTTREEGDVMARLVEQHMGQDGEQAAEVRSAEDVVYMLELLRNQLERLRGQTALGAHLMQLGRLRREIILDHGGDRALLSQVEAAIRQAMSRLGGGQPHV